MKNIHKNESYQVLFQYIEYFAFLVLGMFLFTENKSKIKAVAKTKL